MNRHLFLSSFIGSFRFQYAFSQITLKSSGLWWWSGMKKPGTQLMVYGGWYAGYLPREISRRTVESSVCVGKLPELPIDSSTWKSVPLPAGLMSRFNTVNVKRVSNVSWRVIICKPNADRIIKGFDSFHAFLFNHHAGSFRQTEILEWSNPGCGKCLYRP